MRTRCISKLRFALACSTQACKKSRGVSHLREVRGLCRLAGGAGGRGAERSDCAHELGRVAGLDLGHGGLAHRHLRAAVCAHMPPHDQAPNAALLLPTLHVTPVDWRASPDFTRLGTPSSSFNTLILAGQYNNCKA